MFASRFDIALTRPDRESTSPMLMPGYAGRPLIKSDEHWTDLRPACSLMLATEDTAWLQQDHRWPGLRSIAKVESRREVLVDGKVEEETRYYISSLPGDAKQIGHAVRSHWGVENGLHWVMDMVFRDDECRIRSMHAPANFATIKHMASNLLRRGKGKHSMRASRHIAAWNEDFRYSLLAT